jgi:PST family polysaccharide transporter
MSFLHVPETEAIPTSSTGAATDPHSTLSTLTTRGGVYLGLRYGLGVLVSFANMLVLTRWIGPHAYGLFVTALGLTSFLAALSRGGIDVCLVRSNSAPNRRTYDVASTLIIALSLLLVVIGAAAVPLLVRWFGSHEFVRPYLVSLLTIPLAGLAGPPMARLERELNYRAVAGIELGGQVLALAVGIVLAWRGFGVWAPVAGLLAWQLWTALRTIQITRIWPRFAFDRSKARTMLSFGIGYSTSLRVWQLRSLVNPLVVGRFAGVEAVAFVALAVRIAEGLGFVRTAAGRLTIAVLGRLQDDRAKFQAGLERAFRIQLFALGPLLVLFALVAPVVVPHVLGQRWLPSLRVFPFVAAGVLVNSLYNLQASALFVAGEQWVVLRAYAWHVALLGVATLALVPWFGILGYGWAELVACAAYYVLHQGTSRIFPNAWRPMGRLAFLFLLPPFSLLTNSAWRFALLAPLFTYMGMVLRKKIARTKLVIGDAEVAFLPSNILPRIRFSRTGT